MAFFCFRNEFSQRGKRCNTIRSLIRFLLSCTHRITSLFPFHFIPSPPRPESRLRLHVCSCSPTCDGGGSSLILFSRPDQESLGPAPVRPMLPGQEGRMSSWVSLEFGIASRELCCRKRERVLRPIPSCSCHAAAFSSFCREIRRPWEAEKDASSLRPLFENFFLLSLHSPSANYAIRTNLTAADGRRTGRAQIARWPRAKAAQAQARDWTYRAALSSRKLVVDGRGQRGRECELV